MQLPQTRHVQRPQYHSEGTETRGSGAAAAVSRQAPQQDGVHASHAAADADQVGAGHAVAAVVDGRRRRCVAVVHVPAAANAAVVEPGHGARRALGAQIPDDDRTDGAVDADRAEFVGAARAALCLRRYHGQDGQRQVQSGPVRAVCRGNSKTNR